MRVEGFSLSIHLHRFEVDASRLVVARHIVVFALAVILLHRECRLEGFLLALYCLLVVLV